jgi:glutathione S-transferase
MADMVLHWSPRSPFVRKVMIAAHELGVANRLELRRTVVQMSAPNAELLRYNPLGKIPALLLADGTTLIDSGVICEYFDGLAGSGRLLPAAGVARIRELARHALATGFLDVLILWRNERDKPAERQTKDWIDSFEAKTKAVLTRFERDVEPIAPAGPGLSQIALGCALAYLDFRFPQLQWRDDYPGLAAWHEIFEARPSAQANVIANG